MFFGFPSVSLQVGAFRDLMGKDTDQVANHFDASGIKKLFSHGIRRFNAGQKNSAPRFIF